MEQSPESIDAMLAQAKAGVERYSERLLHLLTFVPDDKLTWTPSSTSRSALHLVAHCAMVSRFFANALNGTLPDPMPSPEDFFKGLHDDATNILTRESAIAVMSEASTELSKAFSSVNADTFSGAANSPFGPMPIPFWIGQGTEHIAGHIGQLEYLQTIWGDLDNHYG